MTTVRLSAGTCATDEIYHERRSLPRTCGGGGNIRREQLSLGAALKARRERLGRKQVRVARDAGITADHLRHLETGVRTTPRREIVHAVASALSVGTPADDRAWRQHLINLAGLNPLTAPSPPPEAQAKVTPWMWSTLTVPGYSAAMFDASWNLLGGNDLMREHLPGLEAAGNLITWHFRPEAHDHLVNWETEAAHAVACFRLLLGQGDNPAVRQVLDTLLKIADFRHFWTPENADQVCIGPFANVIHMLSPDGSPWSLSLERHDTWRPWMVRTYVGKRIDHGEKER